MKKIEIEKSTLLPQIKATRIFKQLNSKETDDLLEISEVYEYNQDEVIIEEGELSPHLFSVLSGSASVVLKQQNGNTTKDVYISTLANGEVFGEAAIFLNVKRTAHVLAVDTVSLLKVEREKLIAFIKKYPAAGIKILMVIIYSLLTKIKQVNHELAYERKDYATQNDIDNLIEGFFKV